MADFDLAIIGGGINGAGIARDAAGRGLKVVLVEQNDLASGTSSASSKLIHGGLRYLEHGALSLVRAALNEREVLLRAAPHLIRPLRFVLPVERSGRSRIALRLGLLLYDVMGRRKILPGTRSLDLITDAAGQPLKRRFQRGYEYSDCFADDARLVVANAVGAAEAGALILTRTRCARADRGDVWQLILNARGRRDVVTARILVNAAGPWADTLAETVLRKAPQRRLRLDKGSHIVVPRLYGHDRAYLLQAADKRVVFAIPFERDFTLIGTTDRNFSGDPAAVAPAGEEIDYLCGVINGYFRTAIATTDVVWAFAGVRALYADGARAPQDIGRDYTLVLDKPIGEAPLLTVYGGKLTTYRRLAEEALALLSRFFPHAQTDWRSWTAQSPLPGGEFVYDGLPALVARAQQRWPFLAEPQLDRLVRAYGTRMEKVLQGAARLTDLGENLGAGLTAAEVRYLMANEWAQTADDVLWRRTKLGLRFSQQEREALDRFMAAPLADTSDSRYKRISSPPPAAGR
jgi:glycerol-3-phosphate dehydrogenase